METKKRIRIVHDSSPMNPWEDWDYETPLMYEGGRNVFPKDYSNGDIREFIIEKVCEHFTENKEELCRITGVDPECHEESDDDEILDCICDAITTNDMEMLVELCELLNLPHKSYTSRGYSQGDCLDVLIVLTDKWFETVGANREHTESTLKGSAELFDQYMWGDVYGFILEECKSYAKVPAEEFKYGSMDNVEFEEEWEEIDSWGGFYGQKWMENGMSDHIPEELHYQLENFDYNDIEY